ncbi:alginate lyase [Micromonospora kangleipakensis]|uniref:Alginate lyase n=1 Tax=Micromonospora kangleipakensis TaxID=1077942 RepID=A0A4Q8B975_9ACTN|nr:alginate lyase family protein [Micromonospora kangleipakensis]RZU73741.1 alginate lyase [Micromonospora kangleipakensis]
MAWTRTRGGIAALVAGVLLVVSAGLLAAEAATAPTEDEVAGIWTSETPRPAVNPVRDARSGFLHPGVLVSIDQLDFAAGKIRAREEPWQSAWLAMQRSRYGQLAWQPRPVATVDCGFYSSPDNGCTNETEDGVAAYTLALLWYFTGDRHYAEKSIEIIDAWSGVLKRHTNSNAPVQAGWSGASFVRAAELLRYTYPGWSPDRLARAERMFRDVYLPLVIAGVGRYRAGNWELIMLDAAIGISVFLDDRASFSKAVARWRLRLPAYIYLTSDGPAPKSPPGEALNRRQTIEYWGGQTSFVDGFAQETCRDFLHTGWGVAAAAHVAETAWIQGLDLYAEARVRLTRAMEFHAAYELGEPVPPWLCGGRLKTGLLPSFEVAYNHYTTRTGLTLPRTGQAVVAARPAAPGVFFAWETLTHAENPR